MDWQPVVEFFTLGRAERDAEFREEVRRIARRGLAIIAGVEFGVTALSFVSLRLTGDGREVSPGFYFAFVALGLAALAAWKLDQKGRHARSMGFGIGILTVIMLTWMDVVCARQQNLPPFAALDVLMVLMVSVAALPATFWQMLAMGVASVTIHNAIVAWAVSVGAVQSPDPTMTPLGVLVMLSAALAGLNYSRLANGFASQRAVVNAELRRAQTENAATMARLAAALSHELNSPLGALKSSTASLAAAAQRHAVRPEERLARVQQELSEVIRSSAERLEQVVGRMQRFTNLDRSDIQPVELKRLVQDVAALCGCNGQIRLDIGDIPRVVTQPALVSGALANLFRRSIERGEPVTVSARVAETRQVDGETVEMRIRLSGPISADPDFEVQDGRVGAGNWDLFQVRQLLRSQGGDARLEGSMVVLSLPADRTVEAAAAHV